MAIAVQSVPSYRSKIIPSFFTIKEGSTFLTKPLFNSLYAPFGSPCSGGQKPSGTRGCNRLPVLRTATLKGWRTIKGLRQVVRAGTAWGRDSQLLADVQGLDGYIVAEKNGQLLVYSLKGEQKIKEFRK